MLDAALWSDLIGKPFKDRGRGPDAYDCFGLLLEIYKRRGIIILDEDYSHQRDDRSTRLLDRLTAWNVCPIEPGAGLLFTEGRVPGHVGVAIDDDRFIHAAENIGQVSIGLLSRGWRSRLIAAYEFTQD